MLCRRCLKWLFFNEHLFVLHKSFCYKNEDTTHVSHLSDAYCKFVFSHSVTLRSQACFHLNLRQKLMKPSYTILTAYIISQSRGKGVSSSNSCVLYLRASAC